MVAILCEHVSVRASWLPTPLIEEAVIMFSFALCHLHPSCETLCLVPSVCRGTKGTKEKIFADDSEWSEKISRKDVWSHPWPFSSASVRFRVVSAAVQNIFWYSFFLFFPPRRCKRKVKWTGGEAINEREMNADKRFSLQHLHFLHDHRFPMRQLRLTVERRVYLCKTRTNTGEHFWEMWKRESAFYRFPCLRIKVYISVRAVLKNRLFPFFSLFFVSFIDWYLFLWDNGLLQSNADKNLFLISSSISFWMQPWLEIVQFSPATALSLPKQALKFMKPTFPGGSVWHFSSVRYFSPVHSANSLKKKKNPTIFLFVCFEGAVFLIRQQPVAQPCAA